MRKKNHTSLNLAGALRFFGRKSMKGLFLDHGKELSDSECRAYISECQSKGWKSIPMEGEDACPDFDYFGGGCPGHEIKESDDQ